MSGPDFQLKALAEFDQVARRLRAPLTTEGWVADYEGLKLRTALQPIFSISHKRIIGYEALIRAFDPDNVSVLPGHLFALPRSEAENVLLDRLCRYLHVQNFSCLSDEVNWLFINVSPQAIASGHHYDSFFGQLLKRTGFPPHRIVVEIVEHPMDDPIRLRDAVKYYKQLGCLTAIDDFGAGHSNFERIWNLRPDIVKLDRQMLVRATEDKGARQILVGIVSLLHQSGCLVLLEGVETREQALIAVDAGVDFVQGFYFQVPSLALEAIIQSRADFEGLLDDYKLQVKQEFNPAANLAAFFRPLFDAASTALSTGATLAGACETLLADDSVSRCYLVGSDGVQLGDTLVSGSLASRLDPRFKPLENTSSADWFRQLYLQDALSEPGTLHVTQPYLSVTGAFMCVTLSCSFEDSESAKVLCCDILST